MHLVENPYDSGRASGSRAKPLSILAPSFLAIALAGCLEDPGKKDKSIRFSEFPSAVSASPDNPAKVSGVVESGEGLDSIIVTLDDEDGRRLSRARVMHDGETRYRFNDFEFGFAASQCDGIYVATFTAYAGAESISKTVEITLLRARDCDAPPGTPLTAVSLSMGAQANARYGSSLDLDEPRVMLAAAARSAAGDVDLIYANSFADDTDKLWSPNTAKDNVSFMSGWSVYNTTSFLKVTGVAFNSVTTAEQLAALWKPAAAVTSSLAVTAGDMVVAKSNAGKLVLISIMSHIPGEAGIIEIKVAK